MSIEILTLLFFLALFVFLFLGLPLSFVLGGISIIFLYATWGPEAFYMGGGSNLGSYEQVYACGHSVIHLHGHDIGKIGHCQRFV